MHSFLDSKAMAKVLRQSLAMRDVNLSHSECLEIVAHQFGLPDWNTLSAIILAATPKEKKYGMADNWVPVGNSEYYRMGLDAASPGVAVIECVIERKSGIDLKQTGLSTMMQSVKADHYRGRKIQLLARIRAEDADIGTAWLRVDKNLGSTLRFDNMMQRNGDGAITGTTGWVERKIVLDVPEEAESIHYGFFLKGYGKVWARSFRLDIVSDETASTDIPRPIPDLDKRHILSEPRNLDFSAETRGI
ncbi:MAG TPA: glyoxalase superfamily protein [Rhizobium sp.]